MLVPGCPIDSENASRPKPRGGLSEIGLVIVHSGLDLDLSLPSVRTIVVHSAILIPRWVLSRGTHCLLGPIPCLSFAGIVGGEHNAFQEKGII